MFGAKSPMFFSYIYIVKENQFTSDFVRSTVLGGPSDTSA